MSDFEGVRFTHTGPYSKSFGGGAPRPYREVRVKLINFEFFNLGKPPTARGLLENDDLILVVTDNLPLYDKESGGLRLTMIIEQLKLCGFKIVLSTTKNRSQLPGIRAPHELNQYEKRLRQAGTFAFLYGLGALRKYLDEVGTELKRAFVSFPHVGATVIPMLRHAAPNCFIGYDMVDYHALRLQREAELSGSTSLFQEADAVGKIEAALFKAADAIFAVSDTENRIVKDIVPDQEVYTLPNAFRIPSPPPRGLPRRKNILFLGGFWHRPNLDAVSWFVEDIFPEIVRVYPDAELQIAGSNMDRRVYDLQRHKNVRALGHVRDLQRFFDSGRVFVAPLRFGAGMKGKVGQSMAFGLPVVATKIGIEGMSVSHGREVLVADEPTHFAAQVIRLLHDDAAWLTLQGAALSYVATHLSPSSMKSSLEHAFQCQARRPSRSTHFQSHAV